MLTLSERPRTLKDFVGHAKIVKDIKSMSKDMSFPQAMIMKGETGTGKTSLALIIAATLNCHNPVLNDEGYNDPCLECPSCKAILRNNGGRDIHFLDGSTMGKDDIIDLSRQAGIRPQFDKNKIFIIDEAQALSKAGSTATDTLVETQWQNVYFILCTMDKNAIKKDLDSRCRTYLFNKVSEDVIAKTLYSLLKKYSAIDDIPSEFIEKGIFLIAEAADGSVRQGIQYLDRCIDNRLFEPDEIAEALGTTSSSHVLELLFYALDKNPEFFKGMSRDTTESFYRYSFKILVEAKLYSITKQVDVEWKRANYEKIIKMPNFTDLYNTYKKYIEARQSVYVFDVDQFFFYVIDYYEKPNIRRRR